MYHNLPPAMLMWFWFG